MEITSEGLQTIENIGQTKAENLVEFCNGDAEFLNNATEQDLRELGFLGVTDAKKIKEWVSASLIAEAAAKAAAMPNSDGIAKSSHKTFEDVAAEADVEVTESNAPDFSNIDSPIFALGPEEEKIDLREVVNPTKIDDGKRYIIKKVEVDNFTVVRKRVLLTPAVCNQCAFDICEHHSLGDYEELDPKTKLQIKQAINQHKILYHPASSKHIVSAREMLTSNLKTG